MMMLLSKVTLLLPSSSSTDESTNDTTSVDIRVDADVVDAVQFIVRLTFDSPTFLELADWRWA